VARYRRRRTKAEHCPPAQIEKLLKHYETLQLEPAEIARQVRENGRLLITTPTQNFELELTPTICAPLTIAPKKLRQAEQYAWSTCRTHPCTPSGGLCVV